MMHGRRDPILILKKKTTPFFIKKNTEWWVKVLLTSFLAIMNQVVNDMFSCAIRAQGPFGLRGLIKAQGPQGPRGGITAQEP